MDALKITGGYSRTALSFVIQNLARAQGQQPSPSWLPVLRNILYRGAPTTPSPKINEFLESIDGCLKTPGPYISKTIPQWPHRIKGDDKSQNFPAKVLFEELIDLYAPEYNFIKRLIYPECPVNEIIRPTDYSNLNHSFEEAVDFFLPQAKLIIEVDGAQHHTDNIQKAKDASRDSLFARAGIKTIRIPTSSIYSRDDSLDDFFNNLLGELKKSKSIQIYKNELKNCELSRKNQKALVASAIFRIQALVLELISIGSLDTSDDAWEIELRSDIEGSWANVALEDILDWIKHLSIMLGAPINTPSVSVNNLPPKEEFSKKTLAIDISVQQRWSEEADAAPETIFVRSHYISKLYSLDKTQATNVDYYGRAKYERPKFHITLSNQDNQNNQKIALLNVLYKLYGYREFTPGQLKIILNILQGRDTIGILPTGGGKSLCYQFSSLLLTGITIIVCPITALIRDQHHELKSIGITRTDFITGELNSQEKAQTLQNLSSGKLNFLIVSPERFQQSEFRERLDGLMISKSISQIVIDEVHCMSEWGHDFRTSYLTLADTIRNHCNGVPVTCLTATASTRVLKDIKIEFNIDDEDVCHLSDSSRNELKFKVINDHGNKKNALHETLMTLKSEGLVSLENPGIVFTPYVNGKDGCFALSAHYAKTFGTVGFFSGGKPKMFNGTDKDFQAEKNNNQFKFKGNQLSLLFATKSFGMGVNKKNIRFTIHYGMPLSMESLYQEAGRAGRDKHDAISYTLFSEEKNHKDVLAVENPDINISDLKKIIEEKGYDRGDLLSQLWFITQSNDDENEEVETIREIDAILNKGRAASTVIDSQKLPWDKSRVEKSIYRLKQLGLVETWTVSDFIRGIYLVDYNDLSTPSVAKNLISLVRRYGDDEASEINKKILSSKPTKEALISILVKWNIDNFVYTRRQSLKTLYEACQKFPQLGEKKFKDELEGYFRIDGTTINLQTFAEYGVEKWPEAFDFLVKPKGRPKDIRFFENILETIPRFLEGYRESSCLDLISSLARLYLDDFNNSDGRERFLRLLRRIPQSTKELNKLLLRLKKFLKHLPQDRTDMISSALCEHYATHAFRKVIHSKLHDNVSLGFCIEYCSHRLNRLKGVLENGC